MRGRDDFNVDTGGEGLEVGDDELMVWRWAGGGQDGGELGEAEGGEDAAHIGVMGEVEIEGLVQGKGRVHAVKGDVDLRRGGGDEVVVQTGEDFLNVADADSAAGGGFEVVISREGEVDAVFEALPFLVGEELAPRRVAKGNSFIGAEGLRVIGVTDVPFEVAGEGLQALGCILEVDVLPDDAGIRSAGCHGEVRVVAVVVAC